MVESIEIQVTLDDIINGIKEDANKCPIAIACKRIFNTEEVAVDIYLNIKDYRYILPREISEFIAMFDAGDEVHPIVFKTSLQEPSEPNYD